MDGVAKVGGKRVDLEEIRAIINKQSGVMDCVVMALAESGGRENRLAALVQAGGIEMEQIRKELSDFLEPWAMPRVIRMVGQIPLLPSGKYDREAILRLLDS
jgi:acyl-coenzyme A synthetase/AMP-(fatty) acid ligase